MSGDKAFSVTSLPCTLIFIVAMLYFVVHSPFVIVLMLFIVCILYSITNVSVNNIYFNTNFCFLKF